MEEKYAYFLATLFGISDLKKEELILKTGSPREVYNLSEKALSGILDEKQRALFSDAKKSPWEREYEEMLKAGISFYPFYHTHYPTRLQNIFDRPFGIFVKGNIPKDGEKTVAVIGARDCSSYGRCVAEELGRSLACAGISVVSGLARGIDGIAMESALCAGGKAYGILGCGVDICYPKQNRSIYEKTYRAGGILSEFVPGTLPEAYRFPRRNRIISAFADAVLVVEARAKSGTLITVDMALEQGKDVYAVPGRVTDALSEGCNRLIAQGCGIVVSPAQFLEEMGFLAGAESTEKNKKNQSGEKPQGMHADLLRILTVDLLSVPKILEKCKASKALKNVSPSEISQALLELYLAGFVREEGGYYALYQPFLH